MGWLNSISKGTPKQHDFFHIENIYSNIGWRFNSVRSIR